MRILVVEDDALLGDALRTGLAQRGFHPDWVRDGDYAVNVGGRIVPVAVSLRPPYDPASERVRG